MAHFVRETFLRIRGEGANAGRVEAFCRFAGCNLWSGREEDRARGPGECSSWCDTIDFAVTDANSGGRFSSAEHLVAAIEARWPSIQGSCRRLVALTGGEPALQVDEGLLPSLHIGGFQVAIETNGTCPLPNGIDLVCVSLKGGTGVVVKSGDELELDFPQVGLDPVQFEGWDFDHLSLQPLDGPAGIRPQFAPAYNRLVGGSGLQLHKYLGIR